MTSDAVKIARINAKAQSRAEYLGIVRAALENPLAVGAAALAINYTAYRAGAYKGVPARSVLGGPIWLTIGQAADPAVDQYSRYELFIMAATTALALSGGARKLGGGTLSNLLGSLTS